MTILSDLRYQCDQPCQRFPNLISRRDLILDLNLDDRKSVHINYPVKVRQARDFNNFIRIIVLSLYNIKNEYIKYLICSKSIHSRMVISMSEFAMEVVRLHQQREFYKYIDFSNNFKH